MAGITDLQDSTRSATDELTSWRRHVVDVARWVVLWGGLISVGISVWWSFRAGDWQSAAILMGTYAGLAGLLAWPGTSVGFRATVLVVVCAGSGAGQLLFDAPHGAGYQILLAASMMAGLLLPRRPAVAWVTLIAVTVFAITGLYGFHIIGSSDPAVGGVLWWLSWSLNFALIATVLLLVQQYIGGRLIASLDESRRGRAELAISEERFRTIFHSVSDAVFIHDLATGKVLEVNNTACQMWQCTEAQALEMTIGQLSQGQEPYSDADAKRWLNEAAANGHVSFEWLARDLQDRLFWVMVTIRRVSLAGRERLLVTVSDIDQQKRAQEEAQRHAVALLKANSAKDELLAMVSHELRTPLTPALLSLGMLRNDTDLPPDVRQEIAMAHDQVELEARLVGDLLDLTNIIAQQLVLQRTPHDIHAVVTDSIRQFRPAFDAAGVQVMLSLEASASVVDMDPTRIQQVMRHLLDNAAKFCPSGGQLRVTSSNQRCDGSTWLSLSLCDSGVGVAPEVAARIFGVFEQADRTRKRQFGGLGIGLAISKGIIELHDGQIALTSDGIGKGCTITLRLPTVPAASA